MNLQKLLVLIRISVFRNSMMRLKSLFLITLDLRRKSKISRILSTSSDRRLLMIMIILPLLEISVMNLRNALLSSDRLKETRTLNENLHLMSIRDSKNVKSTYSNSLMILSRSSGMSMNSHVAKPRVRLL